MRLRERISRVRECRLCAGGSSLLVFMPPKRKSAAMKGKQNAKKRKPAKEGVPDCGRLPRTPDNPCAAMHPSDSSALRVCQTESIRLAPARRAPWGRPCGPPWRKQPMTGGTVDFRTMVKL